MTECLFCRIAAGTIPAVRIYEGDRVVAFHDIDPKAPQHVLVIPREHLPSLAESGPEHADLLAELLLACRTVAEQLGVADSGFRVVFNTNADAGQSVGHLHAHLLGGRVLGWPPG